MMDDRLSVEEIEDTIPAAPTAAELSEVDQQLLGVAVLIGLQVLSYIEQADEQGLHEFASEIARGIRRNKNLMRLLELESADLERVLSAQPEDSQSAKQSEAASTLAPESEPAPSPENAPANEQVTVNEEPVKRYLYSPPGRARRGTGNSLHDYVLGG